MSQTTSRLRRDLGAERLSVALVDRHRATFRIVAWEGSALLARGTELPLATSTQVGSAAAGMEFACTDFTKDASWSRPVDGVMLALGFRSGCALPVRLPGSGVHAVVSISSSVPMDYGRRLVRLRLAVPQLAAALAAPAAPRPPDVLVLTDDPVLGEGLARVVERSGAATVTVCHSLAAATRAATSGADLVLADVRFAGVPLATALAGVRAARPGARVVAVPAEDGAGARREARAAGADAYVPRSRGIAALVSALAPLLDAPAGAPAAGPELTRRELEVLQHLDAGLRFKQLAAALGISEATAKWYARSLFRKLGASSRGEAVFAGRRLGVLP